MSLINSHLKFHGILQDEPSYPGSSGRSTTQKYTKVKGSVGAGLSKTKGSKDSPMNPYDAAGGYAQGVKDVRSMNSDRRQSAV